MSAHQRQSYRIGMIGIWPHPIGGVSATCQALAEELHRNAHQIFFVDTARHSKKLAHDFLAGYSRLERISLSRLFLLLGAIVKSRCKRQLLRLTWNSFRTCQKFAVFRSNLRLFATTLFHIVQTAVWFENRNIQIVHGHHAGLASFIAFCIARNFLSCPVIVTVYASEFTMEANEEWLSVAVYLCNHADGVMCISEYTAQRMRAAGVQNDSVDVIYLACHDAHFAKADETIRKELQAKLALSLDIPVILYVGWLTRRKGPHLLLQALKNLRNSPWQALFVGSDHGMMAHLQQYIIKEGFAQRAQILGSVEYKELLALYDLADIFVFPTLSQDEGFGLVGLEAMAHELPVIAAKTGAIPEVIVHKETGFLFSRGNVQELTDRLHQLISDETLRAQLGRQARVRAKTFSWATTTEQLVSLYARTLARA